MVCQEEKSKSGTKHIQGFVQFINAINFNTLKKIDEKIHWEVCRNIPASINYYKKIETRDGESFTFGINSDNEKKAEHSLSPQEVLDHSRDQMLEDLKKWLKETLAEEAKNNEMMY